LYLWLFIRTKYPFFKIAQNGKRNSKGNHWNLVFNHCLTLCCANIVYLRNFKLLDLSSLPPWSMKIRFNFLLKSSICCNRCLAFSWVSLIFFEYHKCQLIWWEENYISCDKFKKHLPLKWSGENNSDILNLNSLDVWLHLCAFSFFLLYFFLPINKGLRNKKQVFFLPS